MERDALRIRVDDPVVWNAKFCVAPRLQRPVARARRRRQDLDRKCGRAFDAAPRELLGVGYDQQVGLDDVVLGKNDVGRCGEDLAQAVGVEVVFQLSLEPPGDALVDEAGMT